MHDSAASAIGNIVITISALFLLFIALRALMLWYWKINTIVDRLDQVILLIKMQINPDAPGSVVVTVPCTSCKKPVFVTDKYCSYCGLGIKNPNA